MGLNVRILDGSSVGIARPSLLLCAIMVYGWKPTAFWWWYLLANDDTLSVEYHALQYWLCSAISHWLHNRSFSTMCTCLLFCLVQGTVVWHSIRMRTCEIARDRHWKMSTLQRFRICCCCFWPNILLLYAHLQLPNCVVHVEKQPRWSFITQTFYHRNINDFSMLKVNLLVHVSTNHVDRWIALAISDWLYSEAYTVFDFHFFMR